MTASARALDAPLLAAWYQRMERPDDHEFLVPGHKQNTALIGPIVHGDLPLFGGVAPVKTGHELLARAEALAARTWGADWCRFSVAGSTHGNLALALSVGRPGDSVIVSRTLHRSLLIGLVLAGLRPIWVAPEIDPDFGLPGAVSPAVVAEALQNHPEVAAVFIGDPSFVGTRSDLPTLAGICHARAIPLIIDAAWAAHHGFHPELPPHALAAGADAMVTSAHKLLPALNQGAIVLARTTASGGLLDAARLTRGFEAGQTTSPSGAILASIDAARALLDRDGHALSEHLLGLVRQAQSRLSGVPGVRVLQDDPVGLRMDPSKLVLNLAGTGAHGHLVEALLLERGLPVEMADQDVLIPIISFADRHDQVTRLVDTLIEGIEKHRGEPRPITAGAAWGIKPVQLLDPRTAFFSPHLTVSAQEAVGQISAELIAPYPPGVPVLAPGELITAEAVAVLQAVFADGGRIAYAADPTLQTIQVVNQPTSAQPCA